ncbi:MAG: beta-galactosidase [Planctomycetes bacterium]|nr:beta-galactosidase [Planctomycetota bacterium]MBL7038337.1 beta-galactosidase [Pirellulaceae bacterium]
MGGQIVLQWRDVEPAEGRYDFSQIDRMLADLEGRGLSTTIQINGNRKPDWLFQKVPYVKERLSHQVASRQGTLMYWHDTHRDAYCVTLRALGDHLSRSTHRETILGLRMNFNAFGTEHTSVPAEYRSPEAYGSLCETESLNPSNENTATSLRTAR